MTKTRIALTAAAYTFALAALVGAMIFDNSSTVSSPGTSTMSTSGTVGGDRP